MVLDVLDGLGLRQVAYPDDHIGVAVQVDGLSDNARVASEPALPESIADHRHGIRARSDFSICLTRFLLQRWTDK